MHSRHAQLPGDSARGCLVLRAGCGVQALDCIPSGQAGVKLPQLLGNDAVQRHLAERARQFQAVLAAKIGIVEAIPQEDVQGLAGEPPFMARHFRLKAVGCALRLLAEYPLVLRGERLERHSGKELARGLGGPCRASPERSRSCVPRH